MLTQLKQWKEQGLLRSIDYHFAAFMAEMGADKLTQLSAAFCSEYLGLGHICLPVEEIIIRLNDKCSLSELDLQGFCREHDMECLLQNNFEAHALLSSSICVGDNAPLCLQFNALYLTRYALFEQLIADKLLDQPKLSLGSDIKVELDVLFATNYTYLWQDWCRDPRQPLPLLCEKYIDLLPGSTVDWVGVEQLFSQAENAQDLQPLGSLIPENKRCNWQKVSAALALTTARCVISGGPGTGKTTTVTKLLALLLKFQPTLLIKLVAPTGKAAARLTESITHALVELNIEPGIKDKMPKVATTIHRLLGVKANSNHFRFNQDEKLNVDLLVVDEASMVDLPLMAKLLMALPDHARLILLGDKDQLASVEAGAVLGDICHFIESGYSAKKAQLLADLTGYTSLTKTAPRSPNMADNLCLLRKSYRFDQYSGIGYLAKAINSGRANSKKVMALCDDYNDLQHYPNTELGKKELAALVLEGYRPYLQNLSTITVDNRNLAGQLLKQFNQFKILCATREGEWGVKCLNKLCETVLEKAGLLTTGQVHKDPQHAYVYWYVGRPVMITQNNYHLGLYNGDIGLCLLDESLQLRVYFQMPDASIADFQPSRLPNHETVFAMTVHKSQGSEFEHTVLALPENHVSVVSRELIYTAITRAKKQLTLFADLSLMASAMRHKTKRFSRLVERLKSPSVTLAEKVKQKIKE
ncbi:DNA helicase/exodeoxyribonuclease V, alpha subunit [Psychromonas ingrahamii 37]|uniref:RecBCD enzyme subunit RecD n=1 Tax=Psychromonas ingrahamii (strain DSM 17664 / CCUG 51855 / 37) TaxID=357804 RepID=A1SUW2_PSYIN|nr:exodeoxyribonuclease V subunit alpha [Psychromonas ingrahamii]ABM03277.1 DNA helicase/exodeoxyribonuclease V, alpha subunit [Psychromonas ingrahamii 37]